MYTLTGRGWYRDYHLVHGFWREGDLEGVLHLKDTQGAPMEGRPLGMVMLWNHGIYG